MKRVTIFATLMCSLASAGCAKPGFLMTKVIDGKTAVPGTAAHFVSLKDASFDGVNVAFGAATTDGQHVGIFRWTSSEGVVAVAINGQAAPGGDGAAYSDFGNYTGIPSLSNGKIVFQAQLNSGNAGIFSGDVAGPLSRIIDQEVSTPPEGSDYESFLPSPRISQGQIVFGAQVDLPGYCNEICTTSPLTKVASNSDTVPGTAAHFGVFYDPMLNANGAKILFNAVDQAGLINGLYLSQGGTISKLVDTSMAIPGGTGQFTSMWNYAFDGADVVFVGTGFPNYQGLFRVSGGQVSKIVDDTTELPDGGHLQQFYRVGATGDGKVIFAASVDNSWIGGIGIYVVENGTVKKVVAPGDWIDGNRVTNCGIVPDGVSGSNAVIHIEFSASFGSTSPALYLVDLSQPAPP